MMDLANNPEPDEADEEVGAQEQQAEQLAYEREYEDDYSWEQLQEDDQGNLRGPDSAAERRARRTRTLNAAHAARVQRGLIRYLQVVVDLSRAAAATDMRPLRAAVMAGCLARFIRAFFDENPLSQLGLVAMREGTACVLSPLASSPVGCVRGDLGVGGGSRARRARCHMHRQAGRVGDPRRLVSPPPHTLVVRRAGGAHRQAEVQPGHGGRCLAPECTGPGGGGSAQRAALRAT
uniref:Ssl1-like domain-containing protein n=1 Tax=Auxenochlorella protothecoides TaxID=3075 RepID=A0A1D2A663_AUXPR